MSYRKLNEKTIKDAYPIPRIDDNLDNLSGSDWFTSLDCDMAYHQVPLEEEDKEKTAFATPRGGLYQYVTMPFGLCNAPATFQRLIERTLAGLQWYIVVLYLDDIIVFSKTFDGHIDHLKQVFARLTEAGLKLKAKKCIFFKHETSFLGHVVSKEGIKPDPAKINAVRGIQSPRTATDLRSFLGLTSYYRKFVKDYAKLAKPLYELIRPNVSWSWTEACQKAFAHLKEKLTSAPILGYPVVNGSEFILDTDASSYAIGGVLSQIQEGEERVIAYASRTLEKSEQNYCVTRKEMLAVVFFTKYFKHYLLGRHFVLRTDHGSLRWLHNFKEPEGQVQRWLQQLSQFDFEIVHRPGVKHGNADAMSRLVRGNEVICRQCEMPWPESFDLSEQDSPGEDDFELQVNLDILGNSEDESTDTDGARTTDAKSPLPRHQKRKPGRKTNKPAPPQQQKCAEKDLDAESLQRAQSEDEGIAFVASLKRNGEEKPSWNEISDKSPEIKFWLARWELLQIKNDLLCLKWYFSETDVKWRICIPSTLAKSVLWHLHDSHTSGHPGIKKTWEKAKSCPFYWQQMHDTTADYVRACRICGERNDPQRRKRHPMKTYLLGGRFERIAADISGPYPTSANGNTYILVIGDYFTKLTELYPLPNITARTVADYLFRGWIKRYGCPREIHSDQGRQFESALFKEVCALLQIKKTRTSPLHPRSDGMVERTNRTVYNILSKYVSENQRDWDQHLDFIVMALNSTIHETTGMSPYRLVYGEKMTTPIDLMTDPIPGEEILYASDYAMQLRTKLRESHCLVREILKKAAERQKKQYDCRVQEYNYKHGDLVWRNQKKVTPGVKCKISRHWTGPWVITERLCDVLFKIQHAQNSPPVVVHGDNIKPYNGTEKLDWFHIPTQVVEVVAFPCLSHYKRNCSGTTSEVTISTTETLGLSCESNSQYASLSPASCMEDSYAENSVPEKTHNFSYGGGDYETPFPTLCQENGTYSALTASGMGQ
ncbi:MAG: hypothetical protein JAZ10_03920, partial [Candidatus Thiodiazotropha endolucinida]|nr:hypothetical protein [Candidatus Thiodiazotropha taylori]